MIRVTPAPEPPTFDQRVRTPGLRAIAEMVGEKPYRRGGRRFQKRADRRGDIPAEEFPTYWTEALDDLMTAYDRICAYSCFRIHPVTGSRSVDHMAAKSRAHDKVYEWSNYRLASSLLGFQVVPDRGLMPEIRNRVKQTIDRLGLDDFRSSRERDAENYWSRRVSLVVLTEESPFVAKELRRQRRLNDGDI
jgi:hypothetical protein